MKNWPRSAYIANLVLIFIFGCVLAWTYKTTREAYRAVGFSDGSIHQSLETSSRIEKLGAIEDCKSSAASGVPIELVTAKTESIFVVPAGRNTFSFCRAE